MRHAQQNGKRRTKAGIYALKGALYSILAERHPQTVRQVFYQAVSQGLIPKTEAAYQGVVVRLCGQMREAGLLPWAWLADSTRWMRKPTSYSSMEAAIARTSETYRRDLWESQRDYLEIWAEKEALAGVLYPITAEFDVPLMVVRGFPSKDFVHSAAESISSRGKPAFLYYLGDLDPSGLLISKDIERKLHRYAPTANIEFERVAVTRQQVARYKLLTRPTKRAGNPHAKDFRGESVEVDALPVDVLQSLVRSVIERHIDQRQLAAIRTIEQSERGILDQWGRSMKA